MQPENVSSVCREEESRDRAALTQITPGGISSFSIHADENTGADGSTEQELVGVDPRILQEIKDFIQDRDERKKYALRIFVLICAWIGLLFAVLALEAVGSPRGWFHLNDSILLALIGGTTANVLGIFYIVTRYLFPRKL